MLRTVKIGLWLLSIFWLISTASAQQCGPGCPICSGTGNSTGALLSTGTVIPNFLYIPNGEDETGVLNFRGGVTSWMDVGIGYTVKAEKMIWSVRLQPIKESESSWRPAVILGTGSVQTGGSDQSLFFQLTKSFEFNEMFSARLSAGAASLTPDYDKLYGLAGLTLTVTERWSPFISYDGINLHPGLSWLPTDWLTIAGILVESKDPALSVGLRYRLKSEK
jgi:hypothetical protein